MRVWKSPVLYLGLFLLLAVIGSLAAPFIYDWSTYRADLETFGEKITGRKVAIRGPISVRFFPWPSLTASDVLIANPDGRAERDFVLAGRISARMQLAGLFSGNIQVESIVIDDLAVNLDRPFSGVGNWHMTPVANLRTSKLLERVKLDQIKITNATVRMIDGRRPNDHLIINVPLAELASPDIYGPWRLSAARVQVPDHSFSVNLTTGTWKAEEPLRFGLRVTEADGSGPIYGFDGSSDGQRVSGSLRIEPTTNATGKTNAEGEFRPLLFTAKVNATFDAIMLDKIEIMPRDPKDGGTLLSGTAKVMLGQEVEAETHLEAARLDLDQLAGARAKQLLRQGGELAVADAILALLPEAANLRGSVNVTALKVGEETLESVALRIEASPEAIRVRELSASLPGRSRILFDGVFFPGKVGAELAGNLALESNDLRQLVSWVWLEEKESIAKLWTGSRGRLKLQTELGLTQSRFRLSKSQYELDGALGSGELAVDLSGHGAVDIQMDADKFDVDNLVPRGIGAASSGDRIGFTGLVSLLTPESGGRELKLKFNTKELLLNGVAASDVALDLVSGSSGLDVRRVAVGSVSGAKLEASGLILSGAKGRDGSIGFDITADDPRGLLRLAGIIPTDSDPAWSKALGQTALKGSLSAKSEVAGVASGFDISGKSGVFDISASGTFSGAVDFEHLTVSGAGEIKAPSGSDLARLAGLTSAVDDSVPARMMITASGSPADGYLTDLKVEAFGSQLNYNGTLGNRAAQPDLGGKLALRSTDAKPLLAAMGVPIATLPSGVLVLDSTVKREGESVVLPDVTGRLGDTPIGGDFKWAAGTIAANATVGEMSLSDLLAATFLSWSGLQAEMESAFAPNLPFGMSGEIWIRPAKLQVYDAFTAKDAQVGISVTADEIRLAMFGKNLEGRDAALEIGSRGSEADRELDGKLTLPVDLALQLKSVSGTPVAEGNGAVELSFKARGRTPGGALANLRGSGSYDIRQFKLLNISPQEFARLVAAAKDGAGLNTAFEGLRSGEGLDGGDVKGKIWVENGVTSFTPFTIATPEADVTVKVVAEPGEGALDAAVGLQFKGKESLPSMEVSYTGPPEALVRNEDKSELMAKLNFEIMQKGVVELERLQREQQRLAAEEERQRLEDEAKLIAYYAQRDELRLRQRELKVHAEMRLREAEELRLKLEAERAANSELNKAELRQRLRELRIHRRMAKLGILQQQPRPNPQPAAPAAKPLPPEPQVPIILVPSTIEPPPGSPTQQ